MSIRMKKTKILWMALAWMLMAPYPSHPQEELASNVTVQSRHTYSADIEATSGEMDVTETKFDYTHKLKLWDQLPVDASLTVGHMDIHEDDPLEVPSHLESRRLGLSTKFPAPWVGDERFFIGLDIFPTFNTDDWAWESGAFRLPFRGYLILKESDDFILVAGVSVRPEYEEEVLPVIGFIYRPNDRWSFNFASDDPNVSYKLNDQTLLRWELNYAWEEYEVTRGAQEHVVLQYRQTASGFGIEHQFNQCLKGVLSVGAVFGRQLKYKDGTGKIAPDTGLYTNVSFTAAF